MSTDLLEARPTLRAWLDEYAAIEADYLARLADWGIRIAPRDADADVVRAAKDRLREKGAQFRNGDAGIVCGNLSSACVACTGGRGSKTFFLSLKKFPGSKLFGLTTGLAVMKINSELGYRPVTYSELTDDDQFWVGCQSCVNYPILQSKQRKNCLCTAMLFDPEHDTVKVPIDKGLLEK